MPNCSPSRRPAVLDLFAMKAKAIQMLQSPPHPGQVAVVTWHHLYWLPERPPFTGPQEVRKDMRKTWGNELKISNFVGSMGVPRF